VDSYGFILQAKENLQTMTVEYLLTGSWNWAGKSEKLLATAEDESRRATDVLNSAVEKKDGLRQALKELKKYIVVRSALLVQKKLKRARKAVRNALLVQKKSATILERRIKKAKVAGGAEANSALKAGAGSTGSGDLPAGSTEDVRTKGDATAEALETRNSEASLACAQSSGFAGAVSGLSGCAETDSAGKSLSALKPLAALRPSLDSEQEIVSFARAARMHRDIIAFTTEGGKTKCGVCGFKDQSYRWGKMPG
jgi:hypothetical protein